MQSDASDTALALALALALVSVSALAGAISAFPLVTSPLFCSAHLQTFITVIYSLGLLLHFKSSLSSFPGWRARIAKAIFIPRKFISDKHRRRAGISIFSPSLMLCPLAYVGAFDVVVVVIMT